MCTLLIISSLILLLAIIICVRECKKEKYGYPGVKYLSESCGGYNGTPSTSPENECNTLGEWWSTTSNVCCGTNAF